MSTDPKFIGENSRRRIGGRDDSGFDATFTSASGSHGQAGQMALGGALLQDPQPRQQAIDAGHVRCGGERVKVARELALGAVLTIRQGFDELQIEVRALSDRRGAAPIARLLYSETPASRERRERAAEERRAANDLVSDDRPDKRQRRLIHRFKRSLGK